MGDEEPEAAPPHPNFGILTTDCTDYTDESPPVSLRIRAIGVIAAFFAAKNARWLMDCRDAPEEKRAEEREFF